MTSQHPPKKRARSADAALRFASLVWLQHCLAVLRRKIWQYTYASLALAVLLGTSVYWAVLGARIQAGNADQLVNPYLLENSATFHHALLPGQHTFLLKWPLFWLVHMVGASQGAFTLVTVGTVLATVVALVWLLYSIEKRPVIFGALCLALASVLVVIPAQPYPGGILPVNMAMIATRNLEYVVYLGALVFCLRVGKVMAWRFWIGTTLLVLLFASDKLFVPLALGSGLLALATYSVVRRRELVAIATTWLSMSVIAVVGASVLAAVITLLHITGIAGQNGAGPYSAAHGVHQMGLGVAYVVLGIATNMGASPLVDVRLLHDIPHQMWAAMTGAGGWAFVVNGVLFICGIAAAGYYMAASFKKRQGSTNNDALARTDVRSLLAIMLLWSSLVAAVVFVASDHYYPVDARYLAMWFFAFFVCIAAYLHRCTWRVRLRYVATATVILVTSIGSGLVVAGRSYHQEKAALADITKRNELVARSLGYHPVQILVGDYWRVLPIKAVAKATRTNIDVMPLESCTQPRDILSSSQWEPGLQHARFAYLLTLDKSLTGYKPCTLSQIIKAYGRPNSSVVIAGKVSHPLEMLLFYDHGLHQRYSTPHVKVPSTAVPAALSELPKATCSGRSILNVVAHEDDDLLFMNPDVNEAIRRGDCVRTVYVTAGDSGNDHLYWLGRERGSKAAYAAMLNQQDNIWIDRIGRLEPNEFISVSALRNVSQISLIFMRLPDGNLNGNGFGASHHQSLARLRSGRITNVVSVDGQSSYTADQLTRGLATLMDYYQPTEVWTQLPYSASRQLTDHSDHVAVGKFAKDAFATYKNHDTATLTYYVGYPIRGLGENVSGTALDEKRRIFFAYGQFDGATCSSVSSCADAVYSLYLPRKYSQPGP